MRGLLTLPLDSTMLVISHCSYILQDPHAVKQQLVPSDMSNLL